ncbi:MAG: hypothetical protein U0Q19_08565 [Kineosporiaceae bacterium]
MNSGGGSTPPGGSAGPSRRAIGFWLAGAVVSGLLAGGVLTVVRPPAPRTVAASAGTSASPTSAVPASSSPSGSASRSPSASASPPAAEPATLIDKPWENKALELSELKSVKRGAGDTVVITVDRLTFYIGAKAADYYKKHPDLEPAEYAIANQSPRIYTFTLVPGTPIFLGPMIGQTDPPQPADAAKLASGFAAAKAAGTKSYVWLKHDGKDKGWVTYLAEQYLP